mgnify:FL=1
MHYLKPNFTLLLLSILLVSCSSNKVLFKKIPQNLKIEIPEAVINNGDLLDINISSLNSESTAIFEHTSLSKIGTVRTTEARKWEGYVVDSSGNIVLPIIGSLKASGLTCSEFSEIIKIKLEEYVLNPTVRIKILNFEVSILGEVAKPGRYNAINQNISLTALISRAGGFTNSANPSKVLIIRNTNNEIQTQYVDLTSHEFLTSEYYFLKQNDEVYVKPDNVSLALDFGFLRSISSLALLASIATTILLIAR